MARREEGRWARHDGEWRDPAQIVALWGDAGARDPGLLSYRARGSWWETLAALDVTLLVTREYEHLVVALTVADGAPRVSYLQVPHPSGLAVDTASGSVHLASTRNPNVVYELAPAAGRLARLDDRTDSPSPGRPLVPVRARFLPGCLYLHDLAMIDGALHATAVGQNAIIRLHDDGRYARVWWPRCIEAASGPVFGRNHLQLNSIAAGPDLASSYFSASADRLSERRPGHRNFPVDGRGVIFSGATRDVVARGLTRPHSARLANGRLWVNNSGYGELGTIEDGHFVPILRLPGWTRGLAFSGSVAFVGTSRVLPRFRRYAPGLDLETSLCGVHAVDTASGRVLGSLLWPAGNQIFAIDCAPTKLTSGFPFRGGRPRSRRQERALFYAFATRFEEG